MAGQQREYKQRISSAQGMKKIFQAQEMIAASRIGRAQDRVTATTPYARAINRAVSAVAAHTDRSEADHPYFGERRESGRAVVLVVTSDRGMAGSYSQNAIRLSERLQNALREEGKEPLLYVVGRKGASYFSFRERRIEKVWAPVDEAGLVELAREISDTVQERLLSRDPAVLADELYMVSTRFTSRFRQTERATRLVPIEIEESIPEPGEGTALPLYDFGPDAETVLAELMPRYVESRIINYLMQSMASEHAARQRAMASATDNAQDQIQKYTRLANSARQAEVTQEITEIVGGADALTAGAKKKR